MSTLHSHSNCAPALSALHSRRSCEGKAARWVALLSLLLVWLVPQAHLLVEHGGVPASPVAVHAKLANAGTYANATPQADGADLCMLCTVFGSVLETALPRVAVPAAPARNVATFAAPHVAARPPTFDLLSRPPPVSPATLRPGVGPLLSFA